MTGRLREPLQCAKTRQSRPILAYRAARPGNANRFSDVAGVLSALAHSGAPITTATLSAREWCRCPELSAASVFPLRGLVSLFAAWRAQRCPLEASGHA